MAMDLVGQRFGRLVVLEFAGHNKHGQRQWRCLCDCGTEKVVPTQSLKSGNTQSCGCLQREMAAHRTLPPGEAGFNRLYNSYKHNARIRGHIFELTENDFRELTKMNCFYCGVKPTQISFTPTSGSDYIYNGVDRVDNCLGYTADNVVPCCSACNLMKRSWTTEEFLVHIKKIYEYQENTN